MDVMCDRSYHNISTDSVKLVEDDILDETLYRTANDSDLIQDAPTTSKNVNNSNTLNLSALNVDPEQAVNFLQSSPVKNQTCDIDLRPTIQRDDSTISNTPSEFMSAEQDELKVETEFITNNRSSESLGNLLDEVLVSNGPNLNRLNQSNLDIDIDSEAIEANAESETPVPCAESECVINERNEGPTYNENNISINSLDISKLLEFTELGSPNQAVSNYSGNETMLLEETLIIAAQTELCNAMSENTVTETLVEKNVNLSITESAENKKELIHVIEETLPSAENYSSGSISSQVVSEDKTISLLREDSAEIETNEYEQLHAVEGDDMDIADISGTTLLIESLADRLQAMKIFNDSSCQDSPIVDRSNTKENEVEIIEGDENPTIISQETCDSFIQPQIGDNVVETVISDILNEIVNPSKNNEMEIKDFALNPENKFEPMADKSTTKIEAEETGEDINCEINNKSGENVRSEQSKIEATDFPVDTAGQLLHILDHMSSSQSLSESKEFEGIREESNLVCKEKEDCLELLQGLNLSIGIKDNNEKNLIAEIELKAVDDTNCISVTHNDVGQLHQSESRPAVECDQEAVDLVDSESKNLVEEVLNNHQAINREKQYNVENVDNNLVISLGDKMEAVVKDPVSSGNDMQLNQCPDIKPDNHQNIDTVEEDAACVENVLSSDLLITEKTQANVFPEFDSKLIEPEFTNHVKEAGDDFQKSPTQETTVQSAEISPLLEEIQCCENGIKLDPLPSLGEDRNDNNYSQMTAVKPNLEGSTLIPPEMSPLEMQNSALVNQSIELKKSNEIESIPTGKDNILETQGMINCEGNDCGFHPNVDSPFSQQTSDKKLDNSGYGLAMEEFFLAANITAQYDITDINEKSNTGITPPSIPEKSPDTTTPEMQQQDQVMVTSHEEVNSEPLEDLSASFIDNVAKKESNMTLEKIKATTLMFDQDCNLASGVIGDCNMEKAGKTPEPSVGPVFNSTPMDNSLLVRNEDNISLSPFTKSLITEQTLPTNTSQVSSIKCLSMDHPTGLEAAATTSKDFGSPPSDQLNLLSLESSPVGNIVDATFNEFDNLSNAKCADKLGTASSVASLPNPKSLPGELLSLSLEGGEENLLGSVDAVSPIQRKSERSPTPLNDISNLINNIEPGFNRTISISQATSIAKEEHKLFQLKAAIEADNFAITNDALNKTTTMQKEMTQINIGNTGPTNFNQTITIDTIVSQGDNTFTCSSSTEKKEDGFDVTLRSLPAQNNPVATVSPYNIMKSPKDSEIQEMVDQTFFVGDSTVTVDKFANETFDFPINSLSGQNHINPLDFDLLEHLIHPSSPRAIERESLYIRFDPLYQEARMEKPQSHPLQNLSKPYDHIQAEKEKRSLMVREIANLHARIEKNKIETEQKEVELKKKEMDLDRSIAEMNNNLVEIEKNTGKLELKSKKIEFNMKQMTEVGYEYQSLVETASKQLKSLQSSRKELPDINEVNNELAAVEQHLKVISTSLVDCVAKYEVLRKVIEEKMGTTDALKAQVADLVKEINRSDELARSVKMVSDAELKEIEQSIVKLNEQFPSEVTVLTALLRKADLTVKNHQDSLDKLIQENKKIVALCDDVIAGKNRL